MDNYLVENAIQFAFQVAIRLVFMLAVEGIVH